MPTRPPFFMISAGVAVMLVFACVCSLGPNNLFRPAMLSPSPVHSHHPKQLKICVRELQVLHDQIFFPVSVPGPSVRRKILLWSPCSGQCFSIPATSPFPMPTEFFYRAPIADSSCSLPLQGSHIPLQEPFRYRRPEGYREAYLH